MRSLFVLGGLLVWAGCVRDEGPGAQSGGEAPSARPTYVGRGSCIECHRREHELWRNSHHDLAMQEATAATVLGDFDDAELTYAGVFAIANVPPEHLQSVVMVECPRLLFPFARRVMADCTRDAYLEMAELTPCAGLVVLGNCGHMPTVEPPG